MKHQQFEFPREKETKSGMVCFIEGVQLLNKPGAADTLLSLSIETRLIAGNPPIN